MVSVAAFTFDTRSVRSRAPVAAVTAASASARIEPAIEFGDQRNAAEDTVRVRRGVQETRGVRRPSASTGKLHTAPVAWKYGTCPVSSRGCTTARPPDAARKPCARGQQDRR